MRKVFYDLEAEENERIREAERKHHDALLLKETVKTREAVQSLCAFMMSVIITPYHKEN